MLVLGLAQFRQGHALKWPVALVFDLDHGHSVPIGALVRARHHIVLHGFAGSGIAQFSGPLLSRTHQRFNPVRHVVKHVVLGQSEFGHRVHRGLLNDHRQTFFFAHFRGPGITIIFVPQGHVQGAATAAHHFGQQDVLLLGIIGDADGPAHMAHAKFRKHLRQAEKFLRRRHMAGQRTAVFRAVLQVFVSGKAKGASLHGFAQDIFHLIQFGRRDRRARTGFPHADHIAAQGRERH